MAIELCQYLRFDGRQVETRIVTMSVLFLPCHYLSLHFVLHFFRKANVVGQVKMYQISHLSKNACSANNLLRVEGKRPHFS